MLPGGFSALVYPTISFQIHIEKAESQRNRTVGTGLAPVRKRVGGHSRTGARHCPYEAYRLTKKAKPASQTLLFCIIMGLHHPHTTHTTHATGTTSRHSWCFLRNVGDEGIGRKNHARNTD